SGGVFGDHCSPISDTTLVASLASGCDHVDHVKTQLPYALACGAVAALGFTLLGALLSAAPA
ncbi:MAG TPA: Na+/H+ antiporter NhaC family protein, partial [Myxococcota bacterium]|nr:Na+/H+ antiporter NhaC family protein [Myxococcota bacterium]